RKTCRQRQREVVRLEVVRHVEELALGQLVPVGLIVVHPVGVGPRQRSAIDDGGIRRRLHRFPFPSGRYHETGIMLRAWISGPRPTSRHGSPAPAGWRSSALRRAPTRTTGTPRFPSTTRRICAWTDCSAAVSPSGTAASSPT